METLWQDIKFGARMLIKSPGFTAMAVLSLAIGIAANTTIFSLVNALLLRPLPGENPGELATVYTSDSSGPLYSASSYPDFVDFRDRNTVFSSLATYRPRPMILSGEDQGALVMSSLVTGNYFDLLGIHPIFGRSFTPAEDEPGAAPVAVLSHSAWVRRFGSDTAIVGENLNLNGKPTTIIGVAPKGFTGFLRGLSVDLWVPINADPILNPGSNNIERRGNRGLFIVGRLKPGVSTEQAQANLRVIGQQLFQDYPSNWTNKKGEPRLVSVLPENQSRIFPGAQTPITIFMSMLMVVVGLVLLIACANVANLLLARATARRKEIAVRLSLGAGRARLIRQLLTESLLLSTLAGAAGMLLTFWIARLLMAFRLPVPVTIALDLSLDVRVLAFTLGLSFLTGIIFGLAPALQASRLSPVVALKEEGAGAGSGLRRFNLRNTLVVSQVAISLLLLIGAGLFLRSLANADAIDPGFDPKNVLAVSVNLDLQGYEAAEGRLLYEQMQDRLASLPEVESATLAYYLPPSPITGRRSLGIEDYEPSPGEDMELHFNRVGPNYFETLRIPLLRGRSFTQSDNQNAPGVVIVNEAFVNRYLPGQDPIGRRLFYGGGPQQPMEIIGLVKTAKYITLGESPRPYVYYPHRQRYAGSMTLLLRTSGAPEAMMEPVREQIWSLDPNLALYDIKTLEENMSIPLLPVRVAAFMLGVFGFVALVLATVGLFGVMAFSVSRRTHEIGIRMALGARPADVLLLVIKQGMTLILIGMVLGLAAAFAVTRFLAFLLYGISPMDPVSFIGVSILLAVAAMLACYIPARRATQVDPMVALRYE